MNNFEQKSGLWVPEPHRTISPERKGEMMKEVEESVTKRKQQEAEEKRKQQEIEQKKKKYETWRDDPMRGKNVQERIRKIEEEIAEERAKSATPAGPEVKTPLELDEESKKAQWKAAAVRERETSMEKMRKLFTPHGEAGGVEVAPDKKRNVISRFFRRLSGRG